MTPPDCPAGGTHTYVEHDPYLDGPNGPSTKGFHCSECGANPPTTPRQRWGTCCPHDPECEHSFFDRAGLTRWMDTPITDEEADRCQ